MARITKKFRKDLGWMKNDTHAYTDDGRVWRWVSNNRCCPLDACEEYGIPCHPPAQERAIKEEAAAFIKAYREANREISDEARAEARAAHGPGVEMVDVISGRRFRT